MRFQEDKFQKIIIIFYFFFKKKYRIITFNLSHMVLLFMMHMKLKKHFANDNNLYINYSFEYYLPFVAEKKK